MDAGATEGERPSDVYPRWATHFAAAAAVLFCVVGVAGNAATAVALGRSARLRRLPTTAFVLALCACDLLFCLLCLPLTAARFAQRAWRLGPALCRLFAFFFYGSVGASLLSMVAVTLTRLLLVRWRALHQRWCRPPRAAALAAAAALLGFAPMLLPLAGVWGRLGLHARTFSCTVLPSPRAPAAHAPGGSPKKLLFVLAFALPCAVIAASYCAIYWRVRGSRRAVRAHRGVGIASSVPSPSSSSSSSSSSSAPPPPPPPPRPARRQRDAGDARDARLTRLMLTIFCCFVLCFLPLMLMNVVDDEVRWPTLHVLASVLAWASAVVNPFIYAVSSRHYRQAYARLLSRPRRPPPPAAA